MTAHDRWVPRSGRRRRGRSTPARPVRDLVPGALKDLGIPSSRITQQIRTAWDVAADDAWQDEATPRRLEGGVLEIGVRSAALRDELANFHAERLLQVLQTALPNMPLIAVRFIADPADGGGL